VKEKKNVKRLMLKILFKILKWVAFAVIWRIIAGAIKKRFRRLLKI
jgi:uncharacterized membrane protein